MSVNYIENLEAASSVRATLNEVIALINIYSASIATGSSYAFTTTLYDNTAGNPMGVITAETACDAYPAGNQHTAYVVKGAGNFDNYNLQSGDILYYDESLSNTFPANYYGWYDTTAMTNKAAVITSGGIWDGALDTCGGISYTAITIYDTNPTPMGEDNSTDACNAYPGGNSHTVYWNQTSPAPTGGDYLYLDSNGNTPLNALGKYFGYYSVALGSTNYILMDAATPGLISTRQTCSLPPAGLTIYSSMVASLMPFGDSSSACSGITNNYTFDVYITKDPANMDPNNIEVGDVLYSDSGKTTPLAAGWWGWSYTAINYSVFVDSFGTVQTKNNC